MQVEIFCSFINQYFWTQPVTEHGGFGLDSQVEAISKYVPGLPDRPLAKFGTWKSHGK